MKRVCRFVALFICLALLAPMIGTTKATDSYADFVFVARDDASAAKILSDSNISEFSETLTVSVITMADFDPQEYADCQAIAIPGDDLTEGCLSDLYVAGVRIYIYGDLTMDSYAEFVGNHDFTTPTPVFDMDGSFSGEYVERDFSSEQKSTKTYQIICNPQDTAKGLLCTFEKGDEGNWSDFYFNVAMEDYLSSLNRKRATIVDAEYNILHYIYSNVATIRLSWILYRDYDEEDAEYDYFFLETRVWTEDTGSHDITQIDVEHSKYYYSDSLIDSGPSSTISAATVAFELGASESGVEGSFGLSYTLNSEPKIVQNTENYPDSVSWTFSKRLLKPALNGDVFRTASYWAIASYHERARFDVNYTCVMELAEQYYQTESIIFLY